MTTLLERLQAGPPSRALSDEVLISWGWRRIDSPLAHIYDRWAGPGGRPNLPRDDRPSPTESVDDALAGVPEGWHIDCLATGDKDTHIKSASRYPRCILRPDLNNDDGWVIGVVKIEFAPTPALAICAAIEKARAAEEAFSRACDELNTYKKTIKRTHTRKELKDDDRTS